MVAVSLAHYLTPVEGMGAHGSHVDHALFRWFYHLPIILAAFWYGLPGGVIAALGVTALYVPHVVIQWHGGTPEQWFEILLYNLVGVVTGVLAQQLKAERDRYRSMAEERNRAYGGLERKARLLLDTEHELRHADRLASLGKLSAGMAHEIKTPLASIRGAAEILAAAGTDVTEREEFASILVRESDRLNRVVGRFLEFARPLPTTESGANLADALYDVLQLVRSEARKLRVEIDHEEKVSMPVVQIDPEQLRQVLLNLVMNALQAMSVSGGRLVIRADLRDGQARVRIRDTGPGIPPSVRARIFDPFVTTRAEGTGLGMAIVKRILDNHSGSIEIKDAEGGGVVVELLLPTRA